MKRILLILLLLILPLTSAENLYHYNSLTFNLDVRGEVDLIPETPSARIEDLTVELLLQPRETFRQEVVSLETSGQKDEDKIIFEWTRPSLQKKEYSFSSEIKTKNQRLEIDQKIPFPILSLPNVEEYLNATKTIDKDNPEIVKKATELAEGEDDLFKVVFNLAYWVEDNIDYQLNTLTADASQKASWVLENRQGVCDEMTSLFIAMCRSLGIPARFVSGVSYTTSSLFQKIGFLMAGLKFTFLIMAGLALISRLAKLVILM